MPETKCMLFGSSNPLDAISVSLFPSKYESFVNASEGFLVKLPSVCLDSCKWMQGESYVPLVCKLRDAPKTELLTYTAGSRMHYWLTAVPDCMDASKRSPEFLEWCKSCTLNADVSCHAKVSQADVHAS